MTKEDYQNGWVHRIDAVPAAGRLVTIRLTNGEELLARGEPGMDCVVGCYLTDDGYINVKDVECWKPAGR